MIQQDQQQHNTICAIVDAARIFGELETAQKLQSNFLSLFMGKSEELLSSVAPYLFPYQTNTEFGKWLLDKGWGNSWGLFLSTHSTLEELRKHFRKFLMVKTDEGNELYFRFYDPRVLRIFLPTCDALQLKDFFGPVDYYAMEDEDPEFALMFRLQAEKLVTERIPKAEFWKIISKGEDNNFGGENLIIPLEQHDSATPQKEETKPPETPKPNSGWSFIID